jgi:hypothetical protein
MSSGFVCPCCGHRVFGEPPGSYEICPVCFWEDDVVQLRWPDYDGGANRPSLVQAQCNYAADGACERQCLPWVRAAQPDEPRDPHWRPIDPSRDNFEASGAQDAPWPHDLTSLYWWRPTFWRLREADKPDDHHQLNP